MINFNRSRPFASPGPDRIKIISIDEIISEKDIRGDELFFKGHYPNQPVFPGVFTFETVLQTIDYHFQKVCQDILKEKNCLLELMEIKSLRFISPMQPGDKLESKCFCHFDKENQNINVKADCFKNHNKKVTTMKLQFHWRICSHD